MKPGRLRHRVIIERDENHGVPDRSGGQQAESWVAVGTRPANVIPLTGRERFSNQQVTAEETHHVEMRYDPDLQTKPVYRLRFGSRPLQIESIINIEERNRELLVKCKEMVA